ncbi:MAG: PIN domain nuclease [bacterium]
MMRKLKLYLDTSIINFAIADDISLEDREVTKKLCSEIKQGIYDGFISEVVLREISATENETKRKALLEFMRSIELEEPLKVNEETVLLAEKYISEEIIPPAYRDDALHIALTTINDIDILVTWNFQHLIKHKTRVKVMGVNTLLGYKNIDICTPKEVVEDV